MDGVGVALVLPPPALLSVGGGGADQVALGGDGVGAGDEDFLADDDRGGVAQAGEVDAPREILRGEGGGGVGGAGEARAVGAAEAGPVGCGSGQRAVGGGQEEEGEEGGLDR